ncbi:unnamed protein product [Caretta caretta]
MVYKGSMDEVSPSTFITDLNGIGGAGKELKSQTGYFVLVSKIQRSQSTLQRQSVRKFGALSLPMSKKAPFLRQDLHFSGTLRSALVIQTQDRDLYM